MSKHPSLGCCYLFVLKKGFFPQKRLFQIHCEQGKCCPAPKWCHHFGLSSDRVTVLRVGQGDLDTAPTSLGFKEIPWNSPAGMGLGEGD